MPTRHISPTDLDLHDIHASQRLVPYLQNLWGRRRYMWFVAVSELRNRQMTSVLGNLWHLLNPMLSIAVYYLIFGVFLTGVNRGVDNYILFITIGVFLFADIQRATIAGGNSIVNNRGLLQALSFPRALLPVTSTITETLATMPSVLVVYAVAVTTGETPSIRWLLFPAVLLVQFFFNLGIAMAAARATVHFRDIEQILPFVFRLLIYTSGVIFSVEAFAGGRSWARLFYANPIYCFLSIGRWTIMGGDLEAAWLISVFGWTITALVVGFLWFRSAEELYGRD